MSIFEDANVLLEAPRGCLNVDAVGALSLSSVQLAETSNISSTAAGSPTNSARITFDHNHSKSGKCGVRWARYRTAQTVDEFFTLSGTAADLRYDFKRGHCWRTDNGVSQPRLICGAPATHADDLPGDPHSSTPRLRHGAAARRGRGLTWYIFAIKTLTRIGILSYSTCIARLARASVSKEDSFLMSTLRRGLAPFGGRMG